MPVTSNKREMLLNKSPLSRIKDSPARECHPPLVILTKSARWTRAAPLQGYPQRGALEPALAVHFRCRSSDTCAPDNSVRRARHSIARVAALLGDRHAVLVGGRAAEGRLLVVVPWKVQSNHRSINHRVNKPTIGFLAGHASRVGSGRRVILPSSPLENPSSRHYFVDEGNNLGARPARVFFMRKSTNGRTLWNSFP